MYRKKTFQEKLADSKDLPRVGRLTGGTRARFGAAPPDRKRPQDDRA